MVNKKYSRIENPETDREVRYFPDGRIDLKSPRILGRAAEIEEELGASEGHRLQVLRESGNLTEDDMGVTINPGRVNHLVRIDW